MKLSVNWDDLGTWDAVGRAIGKHGTNADQSNIQIGETESVEIDAENNVIAAPDKHVSLIDVDDLVVAAYDDRILIAPREESGKLRELVRKLREQNRF